MSWLQLSFETTQPHVDQISTVLEELDALSITLEDAKNQPLLEVYSGEKDLLWQCVRVIALFDSTVESSVLEQAIISQLGSVISPIEHTIIHDQDWQNAWKQYVQPLSYGRLWICPTHEIPLVDNAVILQLDPGMAFGTGSHPTTALCLDWLEKNIQGGECLIDYGCGSGILAMSAIKLGAKKAYAIDCDPSALLTTRENCEKNHLSSEQVAIFLPDEVPPSLTVNILLANILFQPLVELKMIFANLLQQNGTLIVSGLLQSQVDDFLEEYQSHFVMVEVVFKEEWARIVAVRK